MRTLSPIRAIVALYITCTWAPSRENLSSVFAIRQDSNRPAPHQKLNKSPETLEIWSIGVILYKQRTTKAPIRLRGWSAPVLLGYGINRPPRRGSLMQILIIWSIRLKPKQEMKIICLSEILHFYCCQDKTMRQGRCYQPYSFSS